MAAEEAAQNKDGDDPRLEEIQERVDAVRRRLPDNPGLGIPDPDTRPLMPPEEDTNPPV